MQELIKIEKRVIGAEEVNAVSARELHKALEIKKDFSNWIKAQIDRAGLRENVDYIVSMKRIEREVGSTNQKNYTLTTDASKHISMMSQGQKAHAVRDYFIEVEKMYRAEHDSSSLVPVLRMMVKQQDSILEILKALSERVKSSEMSETLSSEQLGKVRGCVSLASEAVCECFRDYTHSHAQKLIYQRLNNMLGTPSYIYIPQHAFDEALKIIKEIEQNHKRRASELKSEKLLERDLVFVMPQF